MKYPIGADYYRRTLQNIPGDFKKQLFIKIPVELIMIYPMDIHIKLCTMKYPRKIEYQATHCDTLPRVKF